MTSADFIILLVTGSIIVIIIFQMIKNKASGCDACAYLKHCQTGKDKHHNEKKT
jgi:hypothetical protein